MGFTDVHALADGRMLFLASAEDSPNAIDDGAVHGTRVGILDAHGMRHADLVDAEGKVLPVKRESIAAVPGSPDRVYVVLDSDDPDVPSVDGRLSSLRSDPAGQPGPCRTRCDTPGIRGVTSSRGAARSPWLSRTATVLCERGHSWNPIDRSSRASSCRSSAGHAPDPLDPDGNP